MQVEKLGRQTSWVEHFFGPGTPPLRRAIRLAFRDMIVETIDRCEGMPLVSDIMRRLQRSARVQDWRRNYEVRCMRAHEVFGQLRAPNALSVTEVPIRRAIVIGSCFAEPWVRTPAKGFRDFECDFVLLNNVANLSDHPSRPASSYDLQVIQIALDSVLPERAYFGLAHADVAAHEKLFEESKARLSQSLSAAMQWNAQFGLLTFVANFFVPQQNPMGKLLPRYDLRNPVHFVEQLNAWLARELERYDNAYLLDADQIAANFGRMFVQDDVIVPLNHGTLLWSGTYELENGRIEQPVMFREYHYIRAPQLIAAIWAEIVAMYRTIRQADSVKLVAIDLDDTLWRGILAEDGTFAPPTTHGWPLGFVETLCYLKKRGVVLAIVSKNEESRIVALWDQIMLGRIGLEDFAFRKINWRPKIDNLQEIIRDMNILPRNVVFIDDNPVERESVKAAFPDVRVLGSHPLYLRRILLWSSETQVTAVMGESTRRTEMVQAQVARDNLRQHTSRAEFLASLETKIKVSSMASPRDRNFPRAFELLNKTNQFNTTGRRWTREECVEAFSRGAIFHVFDVEDRFTRYGIVGVAIAENAAIEQFVMSCRVFGFDVEIAGIAEIIRRMREAGATEIAATLIETDANMPCRDLYQRCGFTQVDNRWIARDVNPQVPHHITVA